MKAQLKDKRDRPCCVLKTTTLMCEHILIHKVLARISQSERIDMTAVCSCDAQQAAAAARQQFALCLCGMKIGVRVHLGGSSFVPARGLVV